MLDADDIETAVRQLDLREVDSGANVLLAEPFDPVVYERTTKRDGLVVAAPTQIAADLLTGSGRMPSEGHEILAWMKANERDWRTRPSELRTTTTDLLCVVGTPIWLLNHLL